MTVWALLFLPLSDVRGSSLVLTTMRGVGSEAIIHGSHSRSWLLLRRCMLGRTGVGWYVDLLPDSRVFDPESVSKYKPSLQSGCWFASLPADSPLLQYFVGHTYIDRSLPAYIRSSCLVLLVPRWLLLRLQRTHARKKPTLSAVSFCMHTLLLQPRTQQAGCCFLLARSLPRRERSLAVLRTRCDSPTNELALFCAAYLYICSFPGIVISKKALQQSGQQGNIWEIKDVRSVLIR